MGRHCGFEFYKLKNGKFEPVKVVKEFLDKSLEMCNWLNVDGRCDCTTLFLRSIVGFCSSKEKESSKEASNSHLEERIEFCLLLNHSELDGFIEKGTGDYWDRKYCYMSLEKFKNEFDFDETQKEHDKAIKKLKDEIKDYKKEINDIRTHQEKAETRVAFGCFEEKINELKDKINDTKLYLQDTIEDDYEYNHSVLIKRFFEIIEDLTSKDPDLIVVAYAND